jgi:hypothetical protein
LSTLSSRNQPFENVFANPKSQKLPPANSDSSHEISWQRLETGVPKKPFKSSYLMKIESNFPFAAFFLFSINSPQQKKQRKTLKVFSKTVYLAGNFFVYSSAAFLLLPTRFFPTFILHFQNTSSSSLKSIEEFIKPNYFPSIKSENFFCFSSYREKQRKEIVAREDEQVSPTLQSL